MKIQVLHGPGDEYAGEIVRAALVRSFTREQVEGKTLGCGGDILGTLLVCINPTDECVPAIRSALRLRGKVLLLGKCGPRVAELAGLEQTGTDLSFPEAVQESANGWFHHSPGIVRYEAAHPLGRDCVLQERFFTRFDYTDEWNNLGYGPITTNDSPWALAASLKAAGGVAETVASVFDGEKAVCDYAALRNLDGGAILWFNRAVGPVDSLEWMLVETFFRDWWFLDGMACIPTLSEIPAGYRGVVSMRLDCDECIVSARPLFEVYKEAGMPFTLAVKTSQPISGEDVRLLEEVLASGGAVISHTHDHKYSWGDSEEEVYQDALKSKDILEKMVPACAPVVHAISPFHSNRDYAVAGLERAGYTGFVSGIIHNDPEYLMARSGVPPFAGNIISHSQQSMLHGESYDRQGRTIDVHLESFINHLKAGAPFGYLDHPFSERYAYDWESEDVRIEAHKEMLRHTMAHEGLARLNQRDLLNFLLLRSRAKVGMRDGETWLEAPEMDELKSLGLHLAAEAPGPDKG